MHRGALGFFALAGEDAKLDFATTCERAAALALLQASINLADDLSDGDCDYLQEPIRRAPGTQILLQSLAFLHLLEQGIGVRVLASLSGDIVSAASAQQLEVRTQSWTLDAFEYCTDGFAARPYAGYLEVIWCSTPLAGRARDIGTRAGFAAHVAGDIESRDRRYETLTPAEHASLLATTLAHLEVLRREPFQCVQALLRNVEPVIAAHAAG